MTPEQVKTLVQMMAERMERESIFSSPDPQTYMHSPYDILDWMVDQKIVLAETVNRWMVEQQEKRRST